MAAAPAYSKAAEPAARASVTLSAVAAGAGASSFSSRSHAELHRPHDTDFLPSVTRSLFVASPMSVSLPVDTLGLPSVTAKLASALPQPRPAVSATSASQSEQQERSALPPVRSELLFLPRTSISVQCPAASLLKGVSAALATANVDFELHTRKWKANCFVYRSRGHANFFIRMYAEPSSNDRYVLAVQRREGCAHVFHTAFNTLLLALADSGLVPSDTESARLSAMLRTEAERVSPCGTIGNAASLCAVETESCDALLVDAEDDMAVMDASAVKHMAASYVELLSSGFDDLRGPAAQSLATLCHARRVRKSLGEYARTTLLVPGADNTDPVVRVFDALATLVLDSEAALQARTTAAFALADLARDANCARLLLSIMLPHSLLDMAAMTPMSAAAAAFRRTLLLTAFNEIRSCEEAKAALLTHDGLKRSSALCTHVRFAGFDSRFDRLSHSIRDHVSASR